MTEEYEEELRQDAETGRRYRIAMEVWREFLDNNREEIVRHMESAMLEDSALQRLNAVLLVMKEFRDVSYRNIQRGEIAEEELSQNG